MWSNDQGGRATVARAVAVAAVAATCGTAAVAALAYATNAGGAPRSLMQVAVFAPNVKLAPNMQQAALAQALTDAPDAAEWIFNNENGDQDGTVGPDGGWVPWQTEPCPTGICHTFYTARRGPVTRRGVMKTDLIRSGAGGAGGRFQALEEASDFPDFITGDEDVPTKDAAAEVNNLYDSFEPVEDQLQKISPTERTQYADFYRAYAAYQLPQEISNRGPGHSWVPSLPNLGPGDNLPPKLYPYSEAYYPSSGGEPVTAVTVNANGAGSTNYFQINGPQQMNVNIGATQASPEIPEVGGYVYPDGQTAMAVAPAASNKPQVNISWGFELAGAPEVKKQPDCDASNPDCNFFQDAYDDAYWR